jgi:hypothetical protein
MAIVDHVQCDCCGKPMTVERPTGHYCSANCRLRAFRARKAGKAAETPVAEAVKPAKPAPEKPVSQARIKALEAEVTQWKRDCEAIQKGQIMRASAAAMAQRKALVQKRGARAAAETKLDEKTKEAFEREIKGLKTKLRTARSKISTFEANGKTILSRADRKAIMVCLHPDGALDSHEKAKREKAFKLFTAAIPEPEEN